MYPRWLLAVFLIGGVSSNAYAATWVFLGELGNDRVYVDTDSRVASGDLVSLVLKFGARGLKQSRTRISAT